MEERKGRIKYEDSFSGSAGSRGRRLLCDMGAFLAKRYQAGSGRRGGAEREAAAAELQDLDAGRHTEIDMFSGALMRMGQELGILTPYNTYTYHMIKVLEEKNDGLFDYE